VGVVGRRRERIAEKEDVRGGCGAWGRRAERWWGRQACGCERRRGGGRTAKQRTNFFLHFILFSIRDTFLEITVTKEVTISS
jgi:hypothetical protein